jgi:hypothetical protein
VLVVESEPLDNRASLVRQQREGDAVFRCEVGQHVDRIVADGKQAGSCLVQVSRSLLQLDELRLAIRSPARAAVEDDKCGMASTRLVEIDKLTARAREDDLGKRLTDGRAHPGEVDVRQRRAHLPKSYRSILYGY